ncbi:MAG: hypothetical protein ABH867_04725 [Patescibacteria group bacterium]
MIDKRFFRSKAEIPACRQAGADLSTEALAKVEAKTTFTLRLAIHPRLEKPRAPKGSLRDFREGGPK